MRTRAVVVFDVTNRDSFEGAKSWVKELQRRGDPAAIIALAGNKADIRDGRAVTAEVRQLPSTRGVGVGHCAPPPPPPPLYCHARPVVVVQEAREFAKEYAIIYMDTSAKTGYNVREIFTAIANKLPRAAKAVDKDVLTDLGEMSPPPAKSGGGCCGGGASGGST